MSGKLNRPGEPGRILPCHVTGRRRAVQHVQGAPGRQEVLTEALEEPRTIAGDVRLYDRDPPEPTGFHRAPDFLAMARRSA